MTMKRKGLIKTISINLLVLLGLLALMEFSAMLLLDARRIFNQPGMDPRANLANYDQVSWARQYYSEKQKAISSYQSYYGWKRDRFQGATLNINEDGHRKTTSRSSDIHKPVIAFLGGSTMFGVGSRDEETIPSYFVEQSNGKFEAINYAEPAFSAFQSYIYLQVLILRDSVRPDMVISYDGVNNSGYGRDIFSHPREHQMQRVLKGTDREQSYFLGHTKALITKLKKKKGRKSRGSHTEASLRLAAKELLDSWLLTRQLCDRVGAHYVCVLQPNAFLGAPDLDHIPELDTDRQPYYQYYTYVKDFLELEAYRSLKENFIDLTRAFDGIPMVYVDFSHTSPIGNEIIAQRILEHVERLELD